MQTDNNLLLRVSECAVKLAVSRSQVYNLINSGEIPAIRLGKSVRIHLRSLEEAILRKVDFPLAGGAK